MQSLLLTIIVSLSMTLSTPTPSGVDQGRATSANGLESARNMLKQQKPFEALQDLDYYKPSRDERSAYQYIYAQALVQLKKPYASIEHYRLAYIYALSDAEKELLLMERADVYAQMGYYSEAAVCLDVFLKTFPRSNRTEQAELGIAVARYHLGEYRGALAHYERAGDSLPVRYGKANTLQALGRTAEAHEIYNLLIANDPEVINASPETIYSLGENYRQTGDLAEAKIYLNSVKDPSLKEKVAMSLGLIALSSKDFPTAIEQFTTAAASKDGRIQRQAIMNRADAFMQTGRFSEAEAALMEIRRNYPFGAEYDKAALLLVRNYRALGNQNKAVSLLKELIFRRTPSAAALDELDAILVDTRDSETLLKLWTSAGRWLMESSRFSSLLKIADGLRHSGRPFLDLCAWLIKNGTDDVRSRARLLLADFHAERGDAATAWGYLGRAKIKTENDQVRRIKVKAYLANKDQLNAAQAIMAIRDLQNEDLLLLLDLMRSLKNKDLEQAVHFCVRTFAKEPAAPLMAVRFADVLYDAGRTKESLAYYQAAVADSKPGLRNSTRSADHEWAQYRIAVLTRGETSLLALQELQSSSSALGRLAAAELKVRTLKEKVN